MIHATVLDRITSTLPDTRLPELGSLGVVLPWSRWLAVCGALGAVISLPALWAVALLADHAWSEAGPAGAVIVALLCAMPILPLARITLVPFAGSRRHDTTTAADEPLAPRRVALAAILLVAGPLAGLTWMVSTPPLTTATAAAAGAVGLLALVGFLLWRCGPRQTNPIASPIRNFAAHGLGIAHMLGVLGAGTEAIGRLLWTALDGGLFAGVPATLNLGVRAAGWLLARLHDGWSGWAVATATGTAVILLWSMWFGGGRW